MALGRKIVTCSRCHHPNLVWSKNASGKLSLYTPLPGTTDPNFRQRHFCPWSGR